MYQIGVFFSPYVAGMGLGTFGNKIHSRFGIGIRVKGPYFHIIR